MTPERFGELLRRPPLLSSQGATELEELIARYPWSGPLRMLRYEKAVLDNNEEAITLWRARAEPYLTTATREEREQRLRVANPARADQHFGFGVESQVEADSLSPPRRGVVYSPDTEPATVDVDFTAVQLCADVIDTVDWYLQRHGLIMEYGRPKPAPKEAFKSYAEWKRKRAKTAWSDLLRLADEKPSRSKTRKRERQSDTTPEVASETLADLLAAQGHVDKAVRMYQQLALRYPTKKATFADRIKHLQQQEA